MIGQSRMQDLIKPVVQQLGFEFVGTEFISGSRRMTIRVYMDTINGITADDCQKVSRALNNELSIESSVDNFVLEVSSPGLDRILFTLEQCESHLGKSVQVILRFPLEGRKKLKGILKSVNKNQDSIIVTEELTDFNLKFVDISRIRIVPVW